MTPMRIALVSSEIAPFAKTGGLADVSAALAAYLHDEGHDVHLFMPLYRRIAQGAWALDLDEQVSDVPIAFGEHSVTFSLKQARLPGSTLKVNFVDCPDLFDRDDIYGDADDEPLRFAALSRAVLASCQYRGWSPQIIHCNDWHTALLPLYLKTMYNWDELFKGTKTLLSLHNLGYQGVFSLEKLPMLALDDEKHLLDKTDTENGILNFLRTGLLYADALSTVSETYAKEIQTPEFGMGLETILQERSSDLVGIVNGVDYSEWNPETDKRIPFNFSREDLSGKRKCRDALIEKMGLPAEPQGPVLGIVSRLTGQKGFEVLPDVLPVLCEHHDIRLTLLGSGEEKYEEYFDWLRKTYPTKVAFHRGYDEDLAHWIEAGADMFLMPSRYEPCGLNQMYSLKYGTIPIVRRTGGLADTVREFDSTTGTGTGFLFEDFSSEAFQVALVNALEAFGDRDLWAGLVSRAMEEDWGWARQGHVYLGLYSALM